VDISYEAQHAWLDFTTALFGGEMYYTYKIDWAAKQAAQ
jgi:hypothetical protein